MIKNNKKKYYLHLAISRTDLIIYIYHEMTFFYALWQNKTFVSLITALEVTKLIISHAHLKLPPLFDLNSPVSIFRYSWLNCLPC